MGSETCAGARKRVHLVLPLEHSIANHYAPKKGTNLSLTLASHRKKYHMKSATKQQKGSAQQTRVEAHNKRPRNKCEKACQTTASLDIENEGIENSSYEKTGIQNIIGELRNILAYGKNGDEIQLVSGN